MGVDHHGSDILVSEKFLNGTDVVVRLEQMCCEGMAKGVACGVLCDAGS